MYDLFVPETVYEREIAKLKAAPGKVCLPNSTCPSMDGMDNTCSPTLIGTSLPHKTKVDENKELNSARKKKEKERLNNMLDKMTAEQKLQKDHCERVLARYRCEKWC